MDDFNFRIVTESLKANYGKIGEPVKFIRENLNVIILVPALLGGIWQLSELLSISPTFIKFFSISQIVPDGILILLYLLTLIFPAIIFSFFYYLLDGLFVLIGSTEFIRTVIRFVRKRRIRYVLLYLFVGGFLPCLFAYKIMVANARLVRFYRIVPIKEFFLYFLLYGCIVTLLILAQNKVGYFLPIRMRQRVTETKPMYIGMFLFYFLLIMFLAFNHTSSFPNNWIDKNQFEKYVTEEFPDKQINVLYMNDMYIFTEIRKDSADLNPYIKVTPIQVLFEKKDEAVGEDFEQRVPKIKY
jgi:hypothetical protein